MDPGGTPAPPANLHRGGSLWWRFHGKYLQRGQYLSFQKCKRTPLFCPSCANALEQHLKEAGVAGLWANEGYLELEKLYASIAVSLCVIFHL